MAMWKRAMILGLVALPLFSGSALAEETDTADAETLVETLRSNKQALVAVNLALDGPEAAAFWPVYARYQDELDAVEARLFAVIESYTESIGSTTDEQALKLVHDYFAVEQDRIALRQKYFEEISAALSGRKVMRFYQIENKVDAVLRYDLAARIPVVEQ